MQEQLPARYYDGKTSAPHDVDVIVTPGYLEIRFADPARTPVTWKLQHIQRDSRLQKKYLRLLYGEFPFEVLEIDPKIADDSRAFSAWREVVNPSWYARLSGNKWTAFWLFLGFIGSIAALYFLVLPALVKPIVNRIPPSYEIELGNAVYASIIAEEVIDSQRTAQLNRFWEAMGYDTEYPVEITVVRNDMVNAFALPGGHIVIFDSILNLMQNSDQLAALLSHEYIHVKQRHSMFSLVSAYSSLILLQLFSGNMNTTAAAILQNASAFKTLKYSRGLEKEADELGMQLMYDHRIDPEGMPQLFDALDKLERSGSLGHIPEYLNSHPVLKNRVAYGKQYSRKHVISGQNAELEAIFREIKGE